MCILYLYFILGCLGLAELFCAFVLGFTLCVCVLDCAGVVVGSFVCGGS